MKGQKILWIDIRSLRQKKGWRQQETANKIGVSRSYLSAMENKRRGISANIMESIINIFGVRYEDFQRVEQKGGEKYGY